MSAQTRATGGHELQRGQLEVRDDGLAFRLPPTILQIGSTYAASTLAPTAILVHSGYLPLKTIWYLVL